jgi:NAD(P)-dependent dehydrogenase (short-subunit alcohol dehydrogenase family)
LFLDLTGKSAIVTGAAQGIGLAIAERLAGAGANVLVADINGDKAQEAGASIRDKGGKAASVSADLTVQADIDRMVSAALSLNGRLDIIVNNAGIAGRAAPIWELTDEDWNRVMALDLTAVFACCRAAIGPMREQKSGAIVNVASISGKEGNPNMIPYSVSKAGVICLTKALAKEVCTEGIRVNCVAPAVIETPILSQLTPEQVAYMCSKIPMGRTGTTQEVAAVVHFLASDDASFVTGQCYDVSGGRATY